MSKITAYTTPWTSVTQDDLFLAVDVHDMSMASSGTDKKATFATVGLLGWINVMSSIYGATGNGSTNDATAIQAAITAAQANNGTVYLPPGTYLLNSPLTMTAPVNIIGAGRESTILKLGNAVNDFALKFTQGSGAITGSRFEHFQINGNSANQTAASGGILASGAVECLFNDIHFTSCYDWGLKMASQPGGAFGHNNRVMHCSFDNATANGIGGGLWMTSNDENLILGCDFQYLGGVNAVSGGQALPVALYDQSGLHMIQNCTFVGARGGNTTIEGILCQNVSKTRIMGCTFDGCGGDNIFVVGSEITIVGNSFTSIGDQGAAANAAAGVHLQFGTTKCSVTGNDFSTSTTSGKTGYFIREESSGGAGSNVMEANTFTNSSSVAPSVAPIATAGAASIVKSNIGYNPVGKLTAQPAVPASTTVLVNPANVDCDVWVTGGTVTVIAIGGQATGQTSGLIPVPAGQSITLTYSVAPTWTWFGN